jgi:uncharacterized YceG family protein
MPDGRDDWEMDSGGNLTPPGGEPKPDTDEFGRDDPDALERERRRREREMRRKGGRPKTEKSGGITGSFRKLRRKEPEPEAPPPTQQQPAAKPPPAAPPQPPRPPRAGNYRRRRFAALVMALGGILLVWFLVAFFQPFAGDGDGGEPVSVDIPQGASAGEIADILADAGVVDSARLFEWRLKLAGKSGDVQADSYSLAEGMSYGAAIDRLTGEQPTGAVTVTIPEGLDRNQIAADVLPEGVSSDEYLKLTKSAPKGFNPARYGAKGNVTLEGFLFPATYDLGKKGGSAELVQQQLQAFEDNIAKVDMSYAKKKNLTAYDVLIIASMIDKEVQIASERDDVAAVIYNRLSQGIPLGIDATTRFETQNYSEQITNADLQKNTPYNTRLNSGLTPGPIGNPGLAAIKAAARPAKVNYIYFVVKPGTCGEHSFTASEAEFEKLAAEYQQALEREGGSPTECPE